MKLIKYIILPLFVLVTLNSCAGLKDGLAGSKKNNNDEFLVQKKNPLVLPPDFDELPNPAKMKTESQVSKNDNTNVENILNKISKKDSKTTKREKLDESLENSILKKINEN